MLMYILFHCRCINLLMYYGIILSVGTLNHVFIFEESNLVGIIMLVNNHWQLILYCKSSFFFVCLFVVTLSINVSVIFILVSVIV